MLVEAFSLVLQLPPLAFGPAHPTAAFTPPRELICPVADLGRIPSEFSFSPLPPQVRPTLRSLQPAPPTYLINRPADIFLLLAAAYAGKASWDTTPWADRTWGAAGGVAPVLIPTVAPPSWVFTR
jgi:hypothetical protein